MEACEEDKKDLAAMVKSVIKRIKDIVGEVENACRYHCFLFQNVYASPVLGLLTQPNNKISDHPELKAFVDDKINVTQKQKFVLRILGNIVGKGENASYQHFLHNVFKKAFFSGWLKIVIVWLRVKTRIVISIYTILDPFPNDKF